MKKNWNFFSCWNVYPLKGRKRIFRVFNIIIQIVYLHNANNTAFNCMTRRGVQLHSAISGRRRRTTPTGIGSRRDGMIQQASSQSAYKWIIQILLILLCFVFLSILLLLLFLCILLLFLSSKHKNYMFNYIRLAIRSLFHSSAPSPSSPPSPGGPQTANGRGARR